MKKAFKYALMACLCIATLSLSACSSDDPSENGDEPPVAVDYFDSIQGLWMMSKMTNLSTGETISFDVKNYKYCYIYSPDGETLYGQAISYPYMSKGEKIQIELDGEKILADGEVIGTIGECSNESGSQIGLVVEWVAEQKVFNPNSYACVAYYIRDTWTKL